MFLEGNSGEYRGESHDPILKKESNSGEGRKGIPSTI
jgi:hypothetical protein